MPFLRKIQRVVPLPVPEPMKIGLPNAVIMRRRGLQVAAIAEAALARSADVDMPESTERFVSLLTALTGPFAAGSTREGQTAAELTAAGGAVEADFRKSGSLGVALAYVEMESWVIKQAQSNPLVNTAVDILAALSTTHGPAQLWYFQNYCLRTSYFLTRRPDADPDRFVPSLKKVVDTFNAPFSYPGILAVVEAIWTATTPLPVSVLRR